MLVGGLLLGSSGLTNAAEDEDTENQRANDTRHDLTGLLNELSYVE
jgi:hypothetical protein